MAIDWRTRDRLAIPGSAIRVLVQQLGEWGCRVRFAVGGGDTEQLQGQSEGYRVGLDMETLENIIGWEGKATTTEANSKIDREEPRVKDKRKK